MTCKVKNCLNYTNHTTNNHKCNKCNNFGHGYSECGNPFLINKLSKFLDEKILKEFQCTFSGCIMKEFHTIQAHSCNYCGNKLHSIETCHLITKIYDIKCPICQKNNIFNKIQKIYTSEKLTCCICYDKNVEIYLPDCGHICLCIECLIKIDFKNDPVLLNLLKNIRSEQMLVDLNYNINLIKTNLKVYPSYIKLIDKFNNISIIRRLNSETELEEFYINSSDQFSEEIDIFTMGYAYINTFDEHLFNSVKKIII